MRTRWLLSLVLCLATGLIWPAYADYAARVLERLPRTEQGLPFFAEVADTAAQRLIAGGKLWLAGDPGFITEAAGRAGGLMMARSLAKPESLQAGDVLLLGRPAALTEADLALQKRGEELGAVVVLLYPAEEAEGPAGAPAQLATATPAMVAALWAFTAELVAACTRQGKTPTLYQSVLVPGGRERNGLRQGLAWEEKTVPPVEAQVLGREYLQVLTACLRQFRATQQEQLTQLRTLAEATRQAGKTVWYACLGHLPPELPRLHGDPAALKPLKLTTPEKLGEHAQAGDLIVYVGYYEPYGPWVETAHGLGAKIVTLVSGTPERPAANMGADLNLSGGWPYGDSAVALPGYDIKVFPASGFMQAVQYGVLVELLTP